MTYYLINFFVTVISKEMDGHIGPCLKQKFAEITN